MDTHLSNDGTLAATGSNDNIVRTYNCSTSGCSSYKNLSASSAAILSVRISADKKMIVAGDMSNKTFYYFGSNFGTNKSRSNCDSPVLSVALSGDASKLATGCSNGKIYYYEYDNDDKDY